jgi:fructokinase
MPPRLGLDLGGTKIAAVVLSDDGRAIWEQRVPTPRHDYDATVARIAALVAEGEAAVAMRCTVGVGMPGAISPATGLVKNANSTWLNGRPLKVDLERALTREVRLANDANCLAVSEATDGAAVGADIVFGVILGTGTGGGIVVRGSVVTGGQAIAGEWGHNPLPWPDAGELPGPPCYCGRLGCLETWLSGPGLAADYARRGGSVLSSEEIVAAVATDALAAATFDSWTTRLARGLASIINVLDPDVIVVGGGLSRVTSIYQDVPAIWSRWIFSDVVTTKLVPAQYGDASGVRGAAWLWT